MPCRIPGVAIDDVGAKRDGEKRIVTRVLHLINGEFYAGAERVQDLLARQLPGLGYSVTFVSLLQGEFAARRHCLDAELISMPMKSRFDLWLAKRLAKLIQERDIAILHTHSPRAALIGKFAASLSGVPMVHHAHSPTTQDTESRWRNIRNTAVERFSLSAARKILAVSGSTRRYLLEQGYGDDRVELVYNGVPESEARRLAYQPGQTLYLGSVALFRPRKGIETLLHAMAILRFRGGDVRLRLVGAFETPGYEQQIRALVSELQLDEYVCWVGFTSDVADELSKMHLLVLPSLFGEGAPMVILEAMAAAVPVVSTLVEGIPEIVRNGQEGLLVEPGSVDQLTRALDSILSGEVSADTLGDSAQLRQRELFSDTAMARRVGAVYSEVLG